MDAETTAFFTASKITLASSTVTDVCVRTLGTLENSSKHHIENGKKVKKIKHHILTGIKKCPIMTQS